MIDWLTGWWSFHHLIGLIMDNLALYQIGPCQFGLPKKYPSQIGRLRNNTWVKSAPGNINLVKLAFDLKCLYNYTFNNAYTNK